MIHNSRQPHNISISVNIEFATSSRTKATLKALIPDNVNFPEGLSLEMFAKGSTLFVEVRAKSVPVETILNTLDEILGHISLCQKVMLD